MNKSPIAWTDCTWNPLKARNLETGHVGHFCVKISPACTNCYAASWNVNQRHARKDGVPSSAGTGLNFIAGNRDKVDLFTDFKELEAPLRKRKPCKIFPCDMTDLFLDDHSDETIAEVFAWMIGANWHTFQVLTKRAERMQSLMTSEDFRGMVSDFSHVVDDVAGEIGLYNVYGRLTTDWRAQVDFETWPPRNIWLGVTAENQAELDRRGQFLLDTPAELKWLSCEPMLERLDARRYLGGRIAADDPYAAEKWGRHGVGWIVCGGESSTNARPLRPMHAAELLQQCQQAGVPFFMKQGSQVNWPNFKDFESFPAALQVRQFPATGVTS